METFATRLRELRLAKGYSQKQLAAQIKVSSQSVSLWERGPRKPEKRYIALLCFVLNCNMEYLLGLTDELNPPLEELTEADYDLMPLIKKDEDLTKTAIQMCQLSEEMFEIVKATIQEAYRQDRIHDRLKPAEDHIVSIISSVLFNDRIREQDELDSSQ